MKPISPKRFAIFVRVSSKGQRDGESPSVQRKLGEDYVRKHGGKVVVTYDGVESGTKPLGERELLQRVLRDTHSGAWDALWILDQSRLTRSPDTLLAISSAFKVEGVELHTMNGRMQLDTPEGELHAGIQSQSDRYFAQKIAQRTRQSRLELLSQGKHAFGRHPWGRVWNKESDTWEIVKKKRALIQRACDLYLDQDFSLADVAQKLQMPKSSLAKALESAGMTEWPRTLNTDEGLKKFPLKIPALLTPDQALAIARRRQRNSTVRPGAARARSLLQGLIRCWHCGGKLSRMPSHKSSGRDYPVYRHLPSTRKEQCLWHVPANLIEADVVHACAEILRDSKQLTAAVTSAVAAEKSGLGKAQARLKDIEEDLLEAKRQLDRAQTELLRLSGAEAACVRLRHEMTKLSTRVRDLEIEQRELDEKVATLNTPLDKPRDITDRLRRLVGWKGYATLTLNTEQKRQLVVLMVGRDKESSLNGIFVRMSRSQGPRTGVWHWELRGTLALVEGDASHYAERAFPPVVRKHKIPELGAIRKLAELTRTLAPYRGDPTVVKWSRSSS